MKTIKAFLSVLGLTLVALSGGCGVYGWTVERVGSVEGFNAPECVVVDAETDRVYVSNIVAAPGGDGSQYWAEDGTGFLSTLTPDGKIEDLHWADSHPRAVLNGPKGLCILGGVLHVADITLIHRIALKDRKPLASVRIVGAKRLNDMATDGTAVYASDTAAGKIYRYADNEVRVVRAPEGVNGITFGGGKMYGVSWALHEIYELDPTGKDEPKPFGLADQFAGLDGIELLDDGCFVVSDIKGGKVCVVSADRKTVRTLVTLDTPADIGLNRKAGLLWVPMLARDRVVTYRLRKGLVPSQELTEP